MWIQTKGIIQFSPENKTKKHEMQSSWKRTAIVLLDYDISLYYAWFIARRYNIHLNRPLRGTHLTVINDRFDTQELNDAFEQARTTYDGTEIELSYNIDVRSDAKHWWLQATSNDAMMIRNQIGLGKPFFDFHITIGRADNEMNQAQSEYIMNLIRKGFIK